MRKFISLLSVILTLTILLSSCSPKEQVRIPNNEETKNNTVFEIFRAILNDEKAFINRTGYKHFLSEDSFYYEEYQPFNECNTVKYSFVDMDGDGETEALITTDLGHFLVLHYNDGEVYSYAFHKNAMYDITTDGAFSFTSDLKHGMGRLKFDDRDCSVIETWSEENTESGITRHIEGIPVTKEEFDSYVSAFNKEKISFTDLDGYPVHKETLTRQDIELRMMNQWSGAVAEGFDGGNGTKESPFVIANAAQFALMSKRVNTGESEGEYFELKKDVDLSQNEWVPIGNNEYPFNGTFDGKGHTIIGLKTTNALRYSVEYKLGSKYVTMYYGTSGLFGVCSNANICNLNIINASVSTENAADFDVLQMGILIGGIKQDSSTRISDVTVTDSIISVLRTNPYNLGGTTLGAGGIVGIANGECNMEKVSSDLTIDTFDAITLSTSYLGGIAGYITDSFECNNALNRLSVKFHYNFKKHYAGAFGYVHIIDGDMSLSNIFSEIRANYKNIPSSTMYAQCVEYNAIIGKLGGASGCVVFKNLFGNSKPIDSYSQFEETRYALYSISEQTDYAENNCLGTGALPEGHGFDTNIWDVSDPSNPVLK